MCRLLTAKLPLSEKLGVDSLHPEEVPDVAQLPGPVLGEDQDGGASRGQEDTSEIRMMMILMMIVMKLVTISC